MTMMAIEHRKQGIGIIVGTLRKHDRTGGFRWGLGDGNKRSNRVATSNDPEEPSADEA